MHFILFFLFFQIIKKNKSGHSLLAYLFSGSDDDAKGRKTSLGVQFKKQLAALMNTLDETEPHYIRCVKPNQEKVELCSRNFGFSNA